MNKRVHIFRRLALASAMVVAMLATSSCNDGLGIFDGQGDCGVYISFKYDYNIKFANAFANEVNSVALYVFDEEETLIDQLTTTNKEALSDDEFEMVLQLDPGEYRLLAWG
ncbi:MAG: FimB/Mfa2 family fimbrial subunit, partial [Alistipes sp.]|nr:FimB/Mfa2 family fimbrial subunit [Alistipes sp.]